MYLNIQAYFDVQSALKKVSLLCFSQTKNAKTNWKFDVISGLESLTHFHG